ncbi:MAG: ABC transporter ATP-binding protein [Bacteroidetes bacterium]|nr:ABC transporter ATP-binding protein [Bacteroidota bacterium]
MKDLKHLNKYLLKYKFHLILGTLFIVISNVFAIIPASIVRHALDLIKPNIDLFRAFQGFDLQESIYDLFASSILIFGLIILLMAILRGIFLFFTRQTIIVMSRHIEYDLKNEIYAHYQTLPLSFYRINNTGDLMARISEDVGYVRMYLGPAIMYSINLITLFLLVIPFMFSVNPTLTLYALIPLPILSISIYFVNNIINRRSEEIQKSLSRLSTFVQEAFSGIRVLKAFVREVDSSQHFAAESEDYRVKSIGLVFVNALFFPLIMSLIGLSLILTVYIGGAGVIDGTVSVGNIAEFIIYVNLLTWPVTALGWVTSIIQRAAASQKRINEFLQVQNDIISEENIRIEVQGYIEFENVWFTYPDSGITALKSVSFKVNPGDSIAVIGTTGSGKSTIANIICRMYDVTQGTVKIDDIDIKHLDIHRLRSQIGYVPQDVFLFSDTIKENIVFGNPGLDINDIHQASKNADLFENIMTFPDGFDTKIGERGITLSGGQKQRVSMARAIARKPNILILDDCLSAVDSKTENTILNSMKLIMQGRTTVIISHRVSSAKLANKIIYLDDGNVVEQGSHESLLAANGAYKALYEKQLLAEEIIE